MNLQSSLILKARLTLAIRQFAFGESLLAKKIKTFHQFSEFK